MAVNERTSNIRIDPGPYLAKVVNHKDDTFMGGLEVTILRAIPGLSTTDTSNIPVNYCSPFLGATSSRFEGNDSSKFDDVQKSYGFWMVPPDIGTTVLVIFADGLIKQGYWIGCVQDKYQNHMVPGIAASRYSELTKEQRDAYGTDLLPVAEYLKGTRTEVLNPGTQKKPVHPFADRLLAQGLLTDTIRGVTSSSARRESPSSVFGISTPGPYDPDGPYKPMAQAGTYADPNIRIPANRLGGSQFVMDDGDAEGQNELIRIRTRTGHQILLHNSSDLIYIANSKGTAWVELTSQGKIDIYAEDSVSMHTLSDFNFKADRDINMEAGRNINISAVGDYHLDVGGDYVVNVTKTGEMTFGSDFDLHGDSNIRQTAIGEMHLKGANVYIGSPGEIHVKADGTIFVQATAAINSKSGTDWKVTAGGSSNITSAHHVETAATIDMNGPTAAAASPATPPDPALEAVPLPTYALPNRSSVAGWSNGKFYKAEDIISIMKRVPTHEPWDHHENINPTEFNSDATDLGTKNTVQPGRTPSVKYTQPAAVKGTPPTPTGNTEEDNIAAFLWMIRVCEGTSGPDGYKTMFTGKLFDSYADHPRQAISAGVNGKGLTSTAAGAYQFLARTWDGLRKPLGLTDFSPESQDQACILLLKQIKALDYVKSGDWTTAVKRSNKTWASLPDSPYNQHPKDYPTALAYFKQGGGTALA